MFDVITIGAAIQDVYLLSRKFRIIRDRHVVTGHAECLAFGTKVELDDIRFEVGGGGTNTAATFARQGLRVAFFGAVGDDPAGDDIIRALRRSGISTALTHRDSAHRTAYSAVFLTGSGERTILVYRGASHFLKAQDVPWKRMRARWFYLSSVAGNLSFVRAVLVFAKRNGTRVAWNPGAAELDRGRLALHPLTRRVDVLLVNRQEASRLVGVPPTAEERLVTALRRITTRTFVVTDAGRGSLVGDPRRVFRVRIRPFRAADTTGAGDAYGSGFVAGLVKRPDDLEFAAKLATLNAAAVVREIGAKHGLLSARVPTDLSRKLQLHIVEERVNRTPLRTR